MDWNEYKIIIRNRETGKLETKLKEIQQVKPEISTWPAAFDYAMYLYYTGADLVSIELLEKED